MICLIETKRVSRLEWACRRCSSSWLWDRDRMHRFAHDMECPSNRTGKTRCCYCCRARIERRWRASDVGLSSPTIKSMRIQAYPLSSLSTSMFIIVLFSLSLDFYLFPAWHKEWGMFKYLCSHCHRYYYLVTRDTRILFSSLACRAIVNRNEMQICLVTY